VTDDADLDVKIDVKKGTARATITAWAAGVAAIIGATGFAFYVVSQAVFAIVALFLNYEEVGFGGAHARYPRPTLERQQAKNKEPTKQDRQLAEPVSIEDKLRGDARTKITDAASSSETRKLGPPLDITPKVVDGGTAPMIAPVQQGDEQEDNPEELPKGAFQENGRWYQVRPFKCETLGGLPMPYEACSVNPNSPSGRPPVRQ
jgi:hypothetical protein